MAKSESREISWEPVEPLEQYTLQLGNYDAFVSEDADVDERWNWRVEPTNFTDGDDEEYASGFFEGDGALKCARRAAEMVLDLLIEQRG